MIRGVSITLFSLGVAGCSVSDTVAPSMTTYGYAFAPPAFYEFCERERALCATTGNVKVVNLTAERRAELEAVNSGVNRRIRQVNDTRVGGRDVWRVPTESGDCEDIALKKKKWLIERGWPASTLLLTVARLRFGNDGHTVLTVRTSKGDYVLDSLTPSVKLWSQTSYRFFARQSQDRHGEWEQIVRA